MKNKSYILKLIILAESDNETYRYLMNNQQVILSIEKGEDFPEDYKQTREKKGEKSLNLLEQSRKIIQLPPHSDRLEVELGELFYQVGFFEERVPDPRKFLSFIKSDPDEAINFVKETPGNWTHFTAQAISSAAKLMKNISVDPSKANNQDIVIPVKNTINAIIELISLYGDKDNEQHKKLFRSFAILFPPLNQNIIKVLNNKETRFLELALEFGTDKFWQQYLAVERFNNFDYFSQIVNSLNDQKIFESELSNQILSKAQSFLDPNLDGVVNLIKAKKLFNAKKSEEFQKQIVNYFTGQGDPGRRDRLFDLFKESKLTNESKIVIINDLIAKKEYSKLKDLVDVDSFNQVIISSKLDDFKNFILSDASDFNNQDCRELLRALLQLKNIEKYIFLENRFIINFSEKIKDISDETIKRELTDYLLNPELKTKIVKIKNSYIEQLKNIKQSLSKDITNRVFKAKVTRFINSLKKHQNVRGKNTRKKRRK